MLFFVWWEQSQEGIWKKVLTPYPRIKDKNKKEDFAKIKVHEMQEQLHFTTLHSLKNIPKASVLL